MHLLYVNLKEKYIILRSYKINFFNFISWDIFCMKNEMYFYIFFRLRATSCDFFRHNLYKYSLLSSGRAWMQMPGLLTVIIKYVRYSIPNARMHVRRNLQIRLGNKTCKQFLKEWKWESLNKGKGYYFELNSAAPILSKKKERKKGRKNEVKCVKTWRGDGVLEAIIN